MKCSPIIIPTLSRVEHLSRLLDSLKGNPLSCYTDIYIGLDFPPSVAYEEKYEKMNAYLRGDFSCFKTFNVLKRSKNLGYFRNVDDLIDVVLEKYDRFIYMDDDLEVSPNFLEYVNHCLEVYEADKDVIAVCGYSYPIEWNVEQGSTLFKESFICPMWGTGFWRDKYQAFKKYIADYRGLSLDAMNVIRSGGGKRMTNVCFQEFVDLCLTPDFEQTLASRVTDISLRMYMSSFNKYAIMPTISKTRNWGFDGTGEFCKKTKIMDVNDAKHYPYHLQHIDENSTFVPIADSWGYEKKNRRLMNKFDSLALTLKIKSICKLLLFLLVGADRYKKMIVVFRQLKTKR